MIALAAFGCGVLFAIGLGLGEMTNPEKVLAFLDVAGNWDPTLGFVMVGALAVGIPLFPRILRRRRPLLADSFDLPRRRDIDVRLLAGAALFGSGWGLYGYCPGPAIVALAAGSPATLVFVGTMALGLSLTRAAGSSGGVERITTAGNRPVGPRAELRPPGRAARPGPALERGALPS